MQISRWFRSQFTPRNVLIQLAWGYIFSGMSWLVVHALGLSVNHPDLWYLLVVPVVVIALGLFLNGIRTEEPRLSIAMDHIAAIDLEVRVEDSTQATVSAHSPETYIFVIASARNAGSPSVVETWTLTVTLPGGQEVKTDCAYLPDVLNIDGRIYHSQDALYGKAMVPIEKGEIVRGTLLFKISGQVSRFDLARPGSIFKLGARDYTGHVVTGNYEWPVNPDSRMGYMPGMLPFEMAAKPADQAAKTALPEAKN